MSFSVSVSIADVRAAAERIAPHIVHTPVLRNDSIDQMVGAQIYFKCENLQRGGAFKMRGALNAVLGLADADARRGVATHSSGNHGNALAIAAAVRGIPAFVVVPRNATRSKRESIAANGAEVIECESTLAARERTLTEVVARTGAHVVHPYDDPRIVAGQGTATLELIETVPGLAQIWVPVGGGGLAAGSAIVCAASSPAVQLIAAEPAGADDAFRSLRAGYIIPQTAPDTIADGLRTSLGRTNFAILHGLATPVALADDGAIARAMKLVWTHVKVIIEPSAAVPLAALIENPAMRRGERIGVVLTGGNVDLQACFDVLRTAAGA